MLDLLLLSFLYVGACLMCMYRVNVRLSVFGKSGAVGDYLTGLTESSATLAKEAILINEPSQGFCIFVY